MSMAWDWGLSSWTESQKTGKRNHCPPGGRRRRDRGRGIPAPRRRLDLSGSGKSRITSFPESSRSCALTSLPLEVTLCLGHTRSQTYPDVPLGIKIPRAPLHPQQPSLGPKALVASPPPAAHVSLSLSLAVIIPRLSSALGTENPTSQEPWFCQLSQVWGWTCSGTRADAGLRNYRGAGRTVQTGRTSSSLTLHVNRLEHLLQDMGNVCGSAFTPHLSWPTRCWEHSGPRQQHS